MRSCPKCGRDDFDDSLFFCLDDGTPLEVSDRLSGLTVSSATTVEMSGSASSQPTKVFTAKQEASGNSPAAKKKPAARHRPKIVTAAAISAALVATVVLVFYLFRPGPSESVISVAVLPFENGSNDASLDYLSDGLSEGLIDKLAQLPQLRVIARASSFRFRGPEVDTVEIGKKLDVDVLVMGRVVRQGDELVVRVEMIDAEKNEQLWGNRYVRNAADAVRIPQEIAQSVSVELALKLSGSQQEQLQRVGTTNPAAYQFYLQGLYNRSRSGNDQIRLSNEQFRKAVEADPDFAAAQANLAISYIVLAGNGMVDPKEVLPKATAAAQRAVELDPNLPDSYLARAVLYRDNWEWDNAEREYRKAVSVSPNYSEAHRRYGQFLSIIGRHDEAIVEATTAVRLDPLSPRSRAALPYAYFFARRYDEAIASAREVMELQPDFGFVYILLGYAYSARGDHKTAIESYNRAIELDNDSTSTQVYLGAAYAGVGDRQKAEQILDELQKTDDYVSQAELAILMTALGRTDEALISLETALERRDLQLQYLRSDPGFDALRDQPRFVAIMNQLKFP